MQDFNIWGLVSLVFLLAVNAFFVAAEYSLVSIRRTRVDELINSGVKEARFIRSAIDNLDRTIAATQVCITMAGIALGWVGEPAFSSVIVAILGVPLQFLDESIRRSISAALALLVVTFITVVVSELVPKSVALKYTEAVALGVGRAVVITGIILRPFIWALNAAAGLILKLIGVPPANEQGAGFTVQELKLMVEASEKIGVIEDIEREMLHNVFDFGSSAAHKLMVPRTEMIAIEADEPVEQFSELAAQHPYTKYPVYENDLDHVIGVVHVKDLVQVQRGNRKAATVRALMREAVFVPDIIRLDSLLREFQNRRQHIAIVLDEYGGTAGLVTLADLIGEIVGPVRDPFDKSTPDINLRADGSALIDGMTPIADVNQQFGLSLQDENYDTIAGYLLGRLERMAKLGDTIETDGIQLKVEAMDGLRIAKVALTKQPDAPPAEAEATPAARD
jgi:CBS domain containing-hemolysin-like protein